MVTWLIKATTTATSAFLHWRLCGSFGGGLPDDPADHRRGAACDGPQHLLVLVLVGLGNDP